MYVYHGAVTTTPATSRFYLSHQTPGFLEKTHREIIPREINCFSLVSKPIFPYTVEKSFAHLTNVSWPQALTIFWLFNLLNLTIVKDKINNFSPLAEFYYGRNERFRFWQFYQFHLNEITFHRQKVIVKIKMKRRWTRVNKNRSRNVTTVFAVFTKWCFVHKHCCPTSTVWCRKYHLVSNYISSLSLFLFSFILLHWLCRRFGYRQKQKYPVHFSDIHLVLRPRRICPCCTPWRINLEDERYFILDYRRDWRYPTGRNNFSEDRLSAVIFFPPHRKKTSNTRKNFVRLKTPPPIACASRGKLVG